MKSAVFLAWKPQERKKGMPVIGFPYGKEKLTLDIPEEELCGVIESNINTYKPALSEDDIVKEAMAHPIGSRPLSELAVGKNKVVIIASDHTRPVPSKHILPFMLDEIRKGNKDADITILIATGCHRGTTKEELIAKLGEDIVKNEKIVVHDCDDESMLTNIGVLPSGSDCIVNRLAAEAELLVAEGFIEPHFFAGFSGGRKSVLPGVAARKTVLGNHCSEFIASKFARTGIIEGNPIHEDMLWAAKKAGLRYIVNVVINAEKKVIYAVAGDLEAAHEKGREFLRSLCCVRAIPADIAISTNGGYPLDQNVYQSVKGMTAAEATVKEGGVIIMLASARDGTGGDYFFHCLADEPDIRKTLAEFMSHSRAETVPDQWEVQILIRILLHASVIYVSELDDETVKAMHMIPAHSLPEAMAAAKAILKKDKVSVTAIPDGVSVVVGA